MTAVVEQVELAEGDEVLLNVRDDGVDYRGPGTVYAVFTQACLVELPDSRLWWVPRADWSDRGKLRRTKAAARKPEVEPMPRQRTIHVLPGGGVELR